MNTFQPVGPANAYLPTWTTEKARWFTRADGIRLRYIVTGDGPPLVLMHTVRTQLDYFQRVIPLLSDNHRVYAVDLPGMGWSDIVPGASYGHDDLLAAIVEFIRGLDLTDTTLVGESMGAVLALTGSVELGEQVTRVVASNTYDYPRGLERANLLARTIIPSVRAPIIGPAFAAMETRAILNGIVSGGYADTSCFAASFLDELVRVGARPGYSRVARAVYRTLATLIAAHRRYQSVVVPTTLIYTSEDWSREPDRRRTTDALPTATAVTIDNVGHFCAMERPDLFVDALLNRQQ
jgi:pimeloyl-ACP methyl ester carboxylesterase